MVSHTRDSTNLKHKLKIHNQSTKLRSSSFDHFSLFFLNHLSNDTEILALVLYELQEPNT